MVLFSVAVGVDRYKVSSQKTAAASPTLQYNTQKNRLSENSLFIFLLKFFNLYDYSIFFFIIYFISLTYFKVFIINFFL